MNETTKVVKLTIDGVDRMGELIPEQLTQAGNNRIFLDRRQFPSEIWTVTEEMTEPATDAETTLYLMQIHPKYTVRSSGF